MNIRVTSRSAIFIALLLTSVIGVILVLQATPEGAGLSDDSIAYIAGARSMAAGHGYREAYLASDGPVTHFPPAFPAVLAFFGFLGIDPLHAARFVNAFLFGLNAALLGILAWRMTPSLTAGLVLAGLFVLCADLLQVHAVAMSEPLFIFLSLLSIWMFDLYFERHHHWLWLLLCAAFSGMAYLTRYSGLALVATYVVALFILHNDWKKRFAQAGIFLAGFVPWALGWAIRNRIVAENATNRALFWHPIPAENWTGAFRLFSGFFIPVETWRRAIFQAGVIQWVTAIVLGAVLVWTLLKGWEFFSKPHQPIPVGACAHTERSEKVVGREAAAPSLNRTPIRVGCSGSWRGAGAAGRNSPCMPTTGSGHRTTLLTLTEKRAFLNWPRRREVVLGRRGHGADWCRPPYDRLRVTRWNGGRAALGGSEHPASGTPDDGRAA